MDLESAQNNVVAKLPLLKQGDYEMWKLRIEQYFQVQEYALWDVIENGNSFKLVPRTTTNADGPVTTEEKAQKKNDVKSRSMLLMALPNEHLLTFSQYKDAKTLFEAIQTRFGGNDATKKTQRTLLKQMYENFNAPNTENKEDLDIMIIDDLYNNFKIVKQEVKRTVTTSSSSGSQNMAFLSSHGSTNEVDTANIQVSAFSTLVSTVSTHDNTANLSDATVYAFLANQSNGSQLVHEDLEQIHEDDLEEMDLKWQLAFLSMRARRDSEINALNLQIEKLKKEKESNQIKIDNFENASKSLDKLIGSQISDNSRTGLGFASYNAVVTPPTGLFAPLSIDLSNYGLEEFQHPEFKGYGPKDNGTKPVLKNVEKGTGQREVRPVWNNSVRINHQNFSNSKRNFTLTTVLTKSRIVPINTARQSSSRAAAPVSASRPINTAAPKPLVNVAKPRQNALQKSHSLSRRPFYQQTTLKNINLHNKVNTAKVNIVNTAKGNRETSVVGKQGINAIKHMTGNISYITDFKEHDGGYVAFGGGDKGSNITSKGTIRTGKLDFKDVYFVKELQFTLFSVSEMCDKNNSVLFTDTECFVMSPNFKLADESYVLLKVPRKNNIYSFDIKNIVPQKDLTCLLAKAINDESMLWHRRLGHINFKNINKLIKDNLVRGLPSKRLENNQTYVACLKGKFTWVFFLATKDETSMILKRFKTENLVDKKVKIIRCDNGTEFKNRVMNEFCKEKGIKKEYSVARTPQQNRVAERRNRILIDAVRTMLVESKLPTTFWAEAINTACYVQNRILVVKTHFKTPYELFKGRTPALSFMRPLYLIP
nr:hypothetical protein [Tanacetum cinerariifolium]